MKIRILLLFTFSFSLFIFSSAQEKKLTQKQLDSLFAVNVLNLDSNFVLVQGGTFEMGLPDTSDVEGGEISKPRHKVTLKSFYILKTHVTQALWSSIMEVNPSFHKGCYGCPVDNVTWFDAQEFIRKLNSMGHGHYRLPTEAEYEYTAGGGNKSHGTAYSGSNNINEVGWYQDDAGGHSQPVGEKKPNELGLYDMSGDMWEWCSDWYEMFYYKSSPTDNPQGPATGDKKVVRGGTWIGLDEGCMVISRGAISPSYTDKYTGFRIVRDL